MRRSKLITLALTVAASGALAVAPSVANAAQTGATSSTFTLTGGTLDITVPASANLGSTAVGSATLSGSLGAVSVTDNRGLLAANWTTTVTSTAFTTGTATANETVANTSIAYSSGVATASTGSGTFTPGVVAAIGATGGTAGVWAGVGVNSATWNPTVTFTLSPSQVAGTYTGTITHSVA
jgi:hypothetical protein